MTCFVCTRVLCCRLLRLRIAPLVIAVFAALWDIHPHRDSLKDLLGAPSENSKLGKTLAISNSSNSMAGSNVSHPLASVTGMLWDAMLAAGTAVGSVETGAVAQHQEAVTSTNSSRSMSAGSQQVVRQLYHPPHYQSLLHCQCNKD